VNEKNNRRLTGRAKALRRNMTKEERHLWYDFLKPLSVTVNRQKVIGSYIADFYCAQAKIVIELDGSQHYVDKGIERDLTRDAYFAKHKIKVLRYSNAQIREEFDRVCEDILQNLSMYTEGETKPSP
jgi:very-short-patch-repair endonuclease